jgi:hypothetical protein
MVWSVVRAMGYLIAQNLPHSRAKGYKQNYNFYNELLFSINKKQAILLFCIKFHLIITKYYQDVQIKAVVWAGHKQALERL